MTELATWIAFEPVPVGEAGLLAIAALTLLSAWVGLGVMVISGRRRAREHEYRHAEAMRAGAERHAESMRALEALIAGQREQGAALRRVGEVLDVQVAALRKVGEGLDAQSAALTVLVERTAPAR